MPELWPSLLRQFMTVVEGRGAILIAKRGDEMRWVASSEEFDELAVEHFRHPEGSQRTLRLLDAQHAGFLTERDLYTDDEIEASQLYQDLMIPRGYGRSVATAISSPPEDTFVLHAEGPVSLGPVPAETIAMLDRVRPHLARAALLTSRLGLRVAGALAGALENLGLPALVISGQARIIACNKLAEALIPAVVMDRADGLHFADPRADRLFWSAHARTLVGGSYDHVLSFPLRAVGRFAPSIAHVVPLRGIAYDVFNRGLAVTMIAPLGLHNLPSADVVQGLFDLTPAEARVAKALGEGRSINEIVVLTGLTQSTVRVHTKRILAKTGAERQAVLVGLLQGLAARGA